MRPYLLNSRLCRYVNLTLFLFDRLKAQIPAAQGAELMGHMSSRMSFRTVYEDMWDMNRKVSWEKQPEDGAGRVPGLVMQSQRHEGMRGTQAHR